MADETPTPEEKDRAQQAAHAEQCPWVALRRKIQTYLPPEVQTHLRNARREVLLAVKSAVEARLASLDEAAPQPARRIEIE
jgi:hypothetical protein